MSKTNFLRTQIEDYISDKEQYGWIINKAFQRVCGIYFLMSGSEIIYVGKSVHILQRCLTHKLEEKKEFDFVWYYKVPFEILGEAEAYFILQLKPKHNSVQHLKYKTISSEVTQFAESLLNKVHEELILLADDKKPQCPKKQLTLPF